MSAHGRFVPPPFLARSPALPERIGQAGDWLGADQGEPEPVRTTHPDVLALDPWASPTWAAAAPGSCRQRPPPPPTRASRRFGRLVSGTRRLQVQRLAGRPRVAACHVQLACRGVLHGRGRPRCGEAIPRLRRPGPEASCLPTPGSARKRRGASEPSAPGDTDCCRLLRAGPRPPGFPRAGAGLIYASEPRRPALPFRERPRCPHAPSSGSLPGVRRPGPAPIDARGIAPRGRAGRRRT